ncbi:hypothetical protein PsalN5692_01039 [Piscirickettsia salmonis]|nr:hypothetical protein PsalN5692_01039 [Piscirickettsia salmonis]
MVECADSRHATLCDADSRGFIVVAFCSAILHHWMCKIPTEVATLTILGFCRLERLKLKKSLNHFAIKYKLILRANQIALQELRSMA